MIIGIDLNSRKAALSLLPTDRDHGARPELRKFAVPTRITDRAVICGRLYEWTAKQVFAEDIVYIESPVVAGARNIQSTIKCSAAYGAVLAAVNSVHARVVEVPISSWKVATTGNGHSSKDDVSAWLYRTHPDVHTECAGDQDLIDSHCIALFGELTERSSSPRARGSLLHQAS